MDFTGKKIEKYVVRRLIGQGGMASVYEAEHEVLGTKAAIKVLNPILSHNMQIRERFLNEAKTMASLQHTNITRIIDFEESDSFLAIIMEFLEGQDLNNRIKSGPRLSEKEIESIFEQTLSAFHYAHGKGVLHRDIKPSNIFILPNGKVKILDFGIAKLLSQGNEMTQTGTQLGTPVYMSPEQVKADKTIDHRSDIYSLGVTLYYAIKGKPPYDGNTTSQFEIFNKIVYEPLPQLQGNSHLNELVIKACQKERELRFQTCEEWLIALKKGLEPSNEPLDSEKTMVDVPISEKTTVDAPAGDKTVFEAPVLEKTTIEQNPSIEQSKVQEQNKEKLASQPITEERVGSKPSRLAKVSLFLGIIGISLDALTFMYRYSVGSNWIFLYVIGFIMGILALRLGILGQKDINKNPSTNKGLGIVGMITGIIAILLSISFIASFYSNSYEEPTYNEGEASENVMDASSAAQETAAGTVSVKEAPIVEAPIVEAPIVEAPAEEDPTEEAPAEEAPVEEYNFDDYL